MPTEIYALTNCADPHTRTHHWRGSPYLELATAGYPHMVTAQADHGHTPDPAIKAGEYNNVHGRPEGPEWEHLPRGEIELDCSCPPIKLRPYHWLLDPYGDPKFDADGKVLCGRRPSKTLQMAGFRDTVADLLRPEDRPTASGHGLDGALRRQGRTYVRGLAPIGCTTLREDPDFADCLHADVDLDEAARR